MSMLQRLGALANQSWRLHTNCRLGDKVQHWQRIGKHKLRMIAAHDSVENGFVVVVYINNEQK